MKQSEIKKLSIEDLNEQYVQLKKNYTDLKMAHAPINNSSLLTAEREDTYTRYFFRYINTMHEILNCSIKIYEQREVGRISA